MLKQPGYLAAASPQLCLCWGSYYTTTPSAVKLQDWYRFILKRRSLKAERLLFLCVVIISPLTVQFRSRVTFQRSFYSIPTSPSRDEEITICETCERREVSQVSMSIILDMKAWECTDWGYLSKPSIQIWTRLSWTLLRFHIHNVSCTSGKPCYLWPAWQKWITLLDSRF